MISFQNPGLIDMRCVSVIGVSVKTGANPFGQFGTGLKYAIAITLRLGGKITIWRGLERYDFDARETDIRGAKVKLVHMNGQELAYATDYGKNWEPWQVYRELACNARDEGGCASRESEPAEDKTTITVECPDIEDWHYRSSEIFLDNSRPVSASDDIEFHEGTRPYIYYRGVRAGKAEHDGRFTVNIIGYATLTEDRVLAYPWEQTRAIAKAVLQSENEDFIHAFLTATEETAEGKANLDHADIPPSPAFMAVAQQLLKENVRTHQHTRSIVLRNEPTPQPIDTELDDKESADLDLAIRAVIAVAGDPRQDAILRVVDAVGTKRYAIEHPDSEVDVEETTLFIARSVIQRGPVSITAVLLEAWLILTKGMEPNSEKFAGWLLDAVAQSGVLLVSPRKSAGSLTVDEPAAAVGGQG